MQKEIAKGCHVEPASLSTILAGMEKNGLITRKMYENNRRNLNVYMTDKGKTISEQLTEHFSNIEKKLCRDLQTAKLKISLSI